MTKILSFNKPVYVRSYRLVAPSYSVLLESEGTPLQYREINITL